MWLEESEDRWIFDSFKYASDNANFEFIDPPDGYMEPCTYPIDLYRAGRKTDFSFTMDSGNIPVVSQRFRDALQGLAEVDKPYEHVVFEPVQIDNVQTKENYFVMIIDTKIDCVDEKRSKFEKYEVSNNIRPDKAGEYQVFFNLVVDPSKINNHHIFRVRKYLSSIIVSEEVKKRLEDADITGAIFESVNGDRITMA